VIVYSNTTPLLALASIGQLELLPALFGEVHVADTVAGECAAGGPIAIPDLASLPWIKIVSSAGCASPHVLLELDWGEKASLALALRDKAGLVIIDEKLGRNLGELLGLRITGTLGVLLKARQVKLIPSFKDAALAMRDRGIFFSQSLVERLAARVGE
jgi:predicted nucleic acid-binding protein